MVEGANIGAITKRFMIITATSASGNGSVRWALFHLVGYRPEVSPGKGISRCRSQCRAAHRVVAIYNQRPHREWYGNLFAMSPASELLIRKLWRQASSNFTVSHIDLNQMGRSEGYHLGSPCSLSIAAINYGGRDVLPLLHRRCRSRHLPENSVRPRFAYYASSAQIRTQAAPLEPDHDPTWAMARLIASRVMPSFSCFAINAR